MDEVLIAAVQADHENSVLLHKAICCAERVQRLGGSSRFLQWLQQHHPKLLRVRRFEEGAGDKRLQALGALNECPFWHEAWSTLGLVFKYHGTTEDVKTAQNVYNTLVCAFDPKERRKRLSDAKTTVASKGSATAEVEPLEAVHNGLQIVRDAVQKASSSNKRVLIEVGGSWCKWSRIMQHFFEREQELSTLRDQHFVYARVDIVANQDLSATFPGFPPFTNVPHLFVLDATGSVVHSQATDLLEQGKDYDRGRFRDFLTTWAGNSSAVRPSDGPPMAESGKALPTSMDAEDREVHAIMAKPLESQLQDLHDYQARQGPMDAMDLRIRVGRIAKSYPNAAGFRLLTELHRQAKYPDLNANLPSMLMNFELNLLETSFDDKQIASMAMKAWEDGSFDPIAGRDEKRSDPVSAQPMPGSNSDPGWKRVAKIIVDELAEPAIKDRFDWSSAGVLLRAMSERGIELAAHRVAHRPARIAPTAARAHWGAAVELLGNVGRHEHIALLEGLATTIGNAEPRLSELCRRAIEQISTDPVRGTPRHSAETVPQGIARRVADHLKAEGFSPKTRSSQDGNTCDIEFSADNAQYRIQVMDPQNFETIAWRLGDEETTLGTSENPNPTALERKIVQWCRQIDGGAFRS